MGCLKLNILERAVIFNGKEWIETHGYDSYDYHARTYYPAIMRFTSVDPLAEKYPSISPYTYCANNPVRYVDPDGRAVKPYGSTAFNIIAWGVSPEESKYVRLDANGYIDAAYMKQGMSNLGSVGGNYSSLMKLVDTKIVLEVHTSSSFETSGGKKSMGQPTYESTLDVMYDIEGKALGMKKEEYTKAKPAYSAEKEWVGWFGITLYLDEGVHGTSTTGNMQVIVNDNTLKIYGKEGAKKMTSTFAHEAYGHALFKISGLPHSHGSKKSLTSDSPVNNKALEIQIYNRENEAERNFDLR